MSINSMVTRKHIWKILKGMLMVKLDADIKNVEINGIKESVREMIVDKMNIVVEHQHS